MPPSEYATCPDAELIAAALAGDGEAFGWIVKRHRPPLLDMASRILGQREEAEDVLQEVFLGVATHLHTFRGESKLSTWFYTITLNRVRNQLRRRANRKTVSLDGGSDVTKVIQEPSEKGPTLEEAEAQRREGERLRQAVEGLQTDFRSIFILHYYQHLPLEEVSRRLSKPLSTVKVYLHRARKQLRAVLTRDPVGLPSSLFSEGEVFSGAEKGHL